MVNLVIGICVLVAVAAFATAWRSRSRLDLRAELFDLLAGAVRRGAALPALLSHMAAEATGTRQRVAGYLAGRTESGDALADALAGLPRHVVPAHVVGAVRAAEGTEKLAPVLERVSLDTGQALALRHRVLQAGLYPLLLLVLVLALHIRLLPRVQEPIVDTLTELGTEATLTTASPVAVFAVVLVALACVLLLAAVALRWIDRLPGRRKLAVGRLLDTSALLVDAGLPVTETFGRTAAASGHAAVERDVRAAVKRVEAGGPMAELWSSMDLPAVDRLRLEASGSHLGRALSEAAASTAARWRAGQERLLRLIAPVTVVLVGALVAIDLRIVMGLLERSHETVRSMLW